MAEKLYTTLLSEGHSEYEEKKSVFLGYAKRIESEEDALAYFKEIRAKHPDARHVVWAFRGKDGVVMRYSEDGEPQGSAGVPMLELLKRADLNDAAVAVVRYFGGVLLGVGGLSRAYGKAAKDAIEDAGIVTYEPYVVFSLFCSYGDFEKYRAEFPKFGVIVDDTRFSDRVEVIFAVKATKRDELCARIREISNGADSPKEIGTRFDHL